MIKKVLGLAMLASAVGLGVGTGCSSIQVVEPDSGVDGSAPTDAGVVKDSTTTLPDRVVTPPSCYDEAEAITGFTYEAPKGNQGVCSDAQLEAIFAGCFRTGADATKCKAATDAAPACDVCLTGPNMAGQKAPWPAFVPVDDQGNGLIAVPVCAGLVLGKPDCGPKLLTVSACITSACSTCETAGEEACETEATAGACKDAIAALGTCQKDLTDGAAQTDPICRGANALASLEKVGKYLCGGASSDAGGGG